MPIQDKRGIQYPALAPSWVPSMQFHLIQKEKEKIPCVMHEGIQELFLISMEVDFAYDHKFLLSLEPSCLQRWSTSAQSKALKIKSQVRFQVFLLESK